MSELRLIDAVKAGDHAGAEALIKSSADVNQQDEQGWTALHFAAGKGDLAMCKLLVENSADIFKVGRDQRTPYAVALAAGRTSGVKYLREAEESYPGEKPPRPQRKYCKAYLLSQLRAYPAWSEARANGGEKTLADDSGDKVVFVQHDFTVTESVWHNENVIFDKVDSSWEEFCTKSLGFKVPDDLDLIVQAGEAVQAN